jgi:polyphosphate glucokinase
MNLRNVLGIDVGGSGIKGAIVDTKTGELISERFRIPTPSPAKPVNVAETILQLVKQLDWNGLVGVGFPAVIQNGVAKTAANVDKTFIGTNIEELFSKTINCPVKALNDADAAGIAEMKFGMGKGVRGAVLLITVGSGIGTAIFTKRKLLTNTELGHIYMPNGITGENYSSDNVRQNEDLSWKEWAKRFNEYLIYMESLFWPDLIIIGGGVSKNEEKYKQFLTVNAKVVSAELQNNAGIIGAAVAAKKRIKDEMKVTI